MPTAVVSEGSVIEPQARLERLAVLVQAGLAVTAALLLIQRLGADLPRVLTSGMLFVFMVLFLVAIAMLVPIARGPRKILLAGLGIAFVFAILAQAAALRYAILHIPPVYPPLGMLIFNWGAHPAMLISIAAAIGGRSRRIGLEMFVDTALLIVAAVIVGMWLRDVSASPLEAAAPNARTFLFFWHWFPTAELMLVALLLAVYGDRFGLRTSAGLALGTVGVAIAAAMQGRAALMDITHSTLRNDHWWVLAVLAYSLTLDVRAIEADAAAHEALENARTDALPKYEPLRPRLVVVAILIAAASTAALGFRQTRSPALALAVTVFALLMAIRAWRTLIAQQRERSELTLSITAERAGASVLESQVDARTRELGEAQRVLQRMWMLGQQITLELNPTRVLQRFIEAVEDIAQGDGACLGLISEDGRIRLVAATGMAEKLAGKTIPLAGSAMGRVISSGEPWTDSDVTADTPEISSEVIEMLAPERIRSIMVNPLQRRGETSGAIAVISRSAGRFGSVQTERIEALTDMLSVALANAELVENLRQAEWRFRTLFRSAPDAVMTVLQSGRIREANDAVKEVIGLDPMLVVGRFIGDFVVEADRDRLADALDAAFARGPSRLEIRFAREGGAHVVALAASRLPEAEPPTVLITGRDITSDREMRSRLLESERLAAVGELVAGVAHEVNNPLSSISAFAQLMLRDGGLTETQRDSIDVIKSEAIRASQVVKDLLAFARRSEPQRDPLDLNKLVDRTLRLRSYELNASKIKIEPSLTLDLPSVVGDARQLQQVILNLITNALQAMASQGGGTLGVITRYDTGNVILEITDTGPGIEPEARARIFEPFFTTKEEGEGTGLGLSVSYGIVNAHGGTIDLAETSEAGTRFIVTLPAVSAPPAPLPIGEPRSVTSRSPLSGIKLLFVDDEPSMRAGVEAFGKLRGFDVMTASDGAEALDMVRSTGFDAIVTDIRMPEMDGLQLYDALRKERPGLASRLIFITGDVISASGQFAAAKQPTLTKPFSFDKLEDMLVAVMRGQASHYTEPAGAGHRGSKS